MTLEEALEAVTVHELDEMDDETFEEQNLEGWYGVSSDAEGGIYAYFSDEKTAARFRMAEVNRLLNE